MSITTYSELQTAISNWLNRSDLTDRIPEFIALAEARFKREYRLRKVQSRTLSVSADDTALGSDYKSLIDLYHDGSTYFGPIQIVDPSTLATKKALTLGTTGAPEYAAVIAGELRMAPVPDQSYSLKMVYDSQITPLATSSTNWLLDDAPDVYLFGSLVESAPYLRDDDRVALWESRLEKAIEQFYDSRMREEYSGTMVRKPKRPIG